MLLVCRIKNKIPGELIVRKYKMEEYIQKELWTEDQYGTRIVGKAKEVSQSSKKKTDAASLWLAELGTASQVKQLIAMADGCKITSSREQPTYWYTHRYVLTLQKKGLEAKVEIEQDSPYEKIRIMDIWIKTKE
jgi:hypothetical protein